MIHVVTGHDSHFAKLVASKIKFMRGCEFDKPVSMAFINDSGDLLAVVVFHDFSPQWKTIQMSCLINDPKVVTRSVLRTVFSYPFFQLGCKRVTTVAAKKHKKARALNKGLGFREEGTMRKALGIDDAVVYGMMFGECKWIGVR